MEVFFPIYLPPTVSQSRRKKEDTGGLPAQTWFFVNQRPLAILRNTQGPSRILTTLGL